MAITPNNYPFSGGAFINGANAPVNREDIHTLTLTKGGSSLGQYNPLIGDTSIDIPSDASDDTSTFTKASGDTSSMTSGSKLSALFTAISSFFASVLSSLGGKADKVQGAIAGNLAALDANGNLADSGKKAADFATATQGAKANSAIQGVKVNGTELSKDGNNVVDVPVPTASTANPLKDGTASVGSSTQWARGDHRHPTDDSREAVSNKKQVVNDSSTTEYPSSKAVADFVNSSVATNTANFLGTITESSLGLDYTATNAQISLALNVHSWESTPTNNDYCFVSVNDPQTTDVDEYRRFKFNGSVWAYEYTLNNSSFTQAQWDAINSGLTSSDRTAYNAAVTLLNTHVGDSSIHVTSSEKNAWTAKQDAVSTDTDSSAFGDTTAIATGFGSNKLHLNLASRLWTYIQGKISSVLGLTASSYGGNAASATNLAPGGASGQYLKSNGSGNAPSWANPSDMTAGIANNLPFGYVRLANTPSSGNAPANAGILCEMIPNLTEPSGYFAELDVFIVQINRVYAKCKVRMFIRSDGDDTTVDYRSWVIWEKANPTNISVTVRRSTTTKKLFLCAKGASGIYAGCYAVLRSASNMFATVSRSLPDWVKMYPNAALQNIDHLIDVTTESNQVGFTSQPVYVDTDGSVKPCGFQVNFGTPIAGTNVLNIITA